MRRTRGKYWNKIRMFRNIHINLELPLDLLNKLKKIITCITEIYSTDTKTKYSVTNIESISRPNQKACICLTWGIGKTAKISMRVCDHQIVRAIRRTSDMIIPARWNIKGFLLRRLSSISSWLVSLQPIVTWRNRRSIYYITEVREWSQGKGDCLQLPIQSDTLSVLVEDRNVQEQGIH